MQVFSFGVRVLLAFAASALAVTAGAAGAGFEPQPTPVVAAIDGGGGPYTKIYNAPNCFTSVAAPGCFLGGWLADYDLTLGGVHVAVGDVTGDGKPDVVTVPGKGGRADVRVFTGTGTMEQSRYVDWFNGGYQLALGDVTGDGRLDYVLAEEDWGGPFLQVIDGRTGARLRPFSTASGGSGVRVAAGDVNGDGRAEIVTAAASGVEPRISIWPGVPDSDPRVTPRPLRSFLAFDPSVTGGVEVAVGDLNGDGRADIAALASGGQGPELRVFDGATLALITDCFPLAGAGAGSLRVAVGDVNGDGKPDLVVAGDTMLGPQIEELTAGCSPIRTLPGPGQGEGVAVGSVDGDGKLQLIVGDGPSADAYVTVLSADGAAESSFAPYGHSFMNGVRIAAGDFNGDGGTEVVTGQGPGGSSEVDLFDPRGGVLLALHPFAGSGSDGVYVAGGDVDGDSHAEIVAGADTGGEPRVSIYDRTGKLLSSFLAFEPSFRGGVRVAVGDVDGDGKAEIVAGSGPGRPAEVRIFTSTGTLLRTIVPFSPFFAGGVFPAAGDLNGDGRAEIGVGAGAGGDGLVRTFDANGTALAGFRPYGDTSSDVRVAIGDVLTPGVGQIVTASGRVARATVDIFDPSGSPAGSILSEDVFGGGLFVGAQEPVGPALQVSSAPPVTVEGRTLTLQLTDPSGRDAPDDVAASAWLGGATSGIDIADAAGSLLLTPTRTFASCGTYPMTIRVDDRYRRSRTVTTTVRVADAPLTGHGLVLHRSTGLIATFRDGNPLASAHGFSVSVRWDGGPATRALVERTGPGRFSVHAGFGPARHGHHLAVVRVEDDCGARTTMRTTLRGR